MKKFTLTKFILAISVAASWSAGAADAKAAKGQPTLLKAIVLNMGIEGRAITDPRYNNVFKQGNAVEGVSAVIRAGKFFINGYALPGTASAFRKMYPSGFLVNQDPWLFYDTGKAIWKGGYRAEKAFASYDAAALATATGIVAGLEIRLYDSNGDGYADLINADYKEGVAIGRIVRNRDNTYTVLRGDVGAANSTASEGRVFDGAHFTSTSAERIKSRNFDRSIAANDVALFWYGPDGWVVRRAKEVRGTFLGGADHENYNIDGAVYQDAMRFSRDNIAVSNRPGEYVNAQKYFGFDKRSDGAKVSLWLVPTTAADAQGAPIAVTSGDSARAFLAKAIAYSEASLQRATVSVDGSDVPADGMWVSPAAHAQLTAAIQRARAVFGSRDSQPSSLDYQTYLLYLTLDGSDNDIGAKFGGFHYAGFVREMKSGKKADPVQ